MSPDIKSKVDVIVVGAGPAGLMAALQLSHMGVSFRIVDKRRTQVHNGQADGLHPRTIEIFDSFNIADHASKVSAPVNALNSWLPDSHGVLKRADGLRMGGNRLSDTRFGAFTLHQGLIEGILLDAISAKSGVNVERGVLPDSLIIDESNMGDDHAYPVHIRLRHLAEEEETPKTASYHGKPVHDGISRSNMTADDVPAILLKSGTKDVVTEDVEAKYLIGCDGAHSWVRKQLGFKLEGETSNSIWGVLDAKVVTDFPDTRMMNTIHSAQHGSVIWIPREAGLVRTIVQMSDVNVEHDNTRFDRSTITPQMIVETAQKIMQPFKISYTDIEWWTVYQVGQRVGDHFAYHNRVFLAGDAVHTHSPKAGQGMNTSMGDTYNLAWKLGSVVQGVSQRNLLETYEIERRPNAQKLIDFDQRLNQVINPDPATELAISSTARMQEFANIYKENGGFMSGLGIHYNPSMITSSSSPSVQDGPSPCKLSAIPIGYRISDYPLINQFSDHPEPLHRLLQSDGRWRILLFAGNLTLESQAHRLRRICLALNAPGSFIRRFTPASKAADAVIEVLGVHPGPRNAMADFEWPVLLKPFRGEKGWDYDKVYADDQELKTYELLGISGDVGCAVVVRPDQHVSWIGGLEDYEGMNEFFGRFMMVQREEHGGAVEVEDGWAGY